MVTPTTRIDASHRIEGALHAAEPVSLHGHLVGEVISDDTFVIEASAIVEGDVHATHVMVLGTVVGTIEGTESVTIGATGQVSGDIKTRAFELLAGGRVRGQVESAASVARRQVGRDQGASWSQGSRRSAGANRSRGRAVTAPTPETKTKPSAASSKPKRAAKKKAKAKSVSKRSTAAQREEVELSQEVVELDNVNETLTS